MPPGKLINPPRQSDASRSMIPIPLGNSTTTVAIGMIIILINSLTFGQSAPDDIKWQTGRELDKSNELALSVSWSDAPIRARLNSFSFRQRVGFFLDRRVDPALQINTRVKNQTTEQFLWRIADENELGICRVGDFYYIGPPETASRLPIAWENLKTESRTHKRSYQVPWTKRKTIRTEAIVQPKTVLMELAKENQFSIKNLDSLPNDVWGKFQLPPTSLEGRVGIILVGFDKWFTRSPDGTAVEIVDFPDFKEGKTVVTGLKNSRSTIKELRPHFPNLKLAANGKTQIKASGPPSELALLRMKMVESQTAIVDPNAFQPFSLTVKAQRINILQKIADDTDHELVVPVPSPAELSEPVDLKVDKAPLSELIEQVLKGTGLKFDLTSEKLTILTD